MNELKAISKNDDHLIAENYIVLFGGRDLEFLSNPSKGGVIDGGVYPNGDGSLGEYFTDKTQFDSEFTQKGALEVDWEHGREPAESSRENVLGIVDWASAKADEVGIKVRRILNRRNKFVSQILEPLIEAGLIGNSTQAVDGKAKRLETGEITEWPLYRDTLTVSPVEPRMLLSNPVALKALRLLAEDSPDIKAAILEADKENRDETVVDGSPKHDVLGNNKHEMEKNLMDENMVKSIVQDAIASYEGEREAAVKAKLDQEAHDKEVAEQAISEFKKSLPKVDELGFSAPTVAKHADAWKYDNYSAADLAAVAEIVSQAKGVTPRRSNPALVKALALRLESSEAKDVTKHKIVGGFDIETPGPLAMAANTMKGAGIKADETNFSTNVGFGDEWIGVAYSGQIWEQVRNLSPVVSMLPQFEFPAGAESMVVPVESTDPVWYLVAQAGDPASATAQIANVIPAKAIGTAQKVMTLGKLGSATIYTGEMVEDSMLPYVQQLRVQIAASGAEYLAAACIDGDVATGATANINDIAGTPAGNEYFLIFDGFRKLPLVTNTANSRDGGALAIGDFLDTVKLMGPAGKAGFDRSRTSFIVDPNTHWAALALAEVLSRDIYSNATIEGGMLARIFGYGVIPSYQFGMASVVNTGYEYKQNIAGKIDVDTAANNTKGSILAVRWDHWRLGFRRRITTEVERIPRADAWEISSLMRVGLSYRDNEASAISYNLTV